MGEKHRPGARPARAGRGPKNNPPRRSAGQNKPNTGAKTGDTGKATQHGKKADNDGCPLTLLVALIAMPYALTRLALDTWRSR